MSKRRHIKFWRYYKEWIETYKDGQVQDVTYAKYLMVQKQIKNLVPDLYLDEMTRRDVQRLINKYGETHEHKTVLDFLHHIQAPLRDAVYDKCPYCTFDPKTHMGADFISGSQIDQTFKEQIDRWDGTNWITVTYIYAHKNYFELVTNNPDSECYSRVLTCTTIEYCPKCGSRLNNENS